MPLADSSNSIQPENPSTNEPEEFVMCNHCHKLVSSSQTFNMCDKCHQPVEADSPEKITLTGKMSIGGKQVFESDKTHVFCNNKCLAEMITIKRNRL